MKNKIKIYLSSFTFGLGIILILSPAFLYWFIHGSYERYMWVIRGPYPFSNFGSGPFQLFMYVGLFIIGLVLTFISFKYIKNKNVK